MKVYRIFIIFLLIGLTYANSTNDDFYFVEGLIEVSSPKYKKRYANHGNIPF